MALTAGFTKACSANSGGILNIWIGNMSEVTSFTLATDGTYSGMTLSTGAAFYKYEFTQDTAEMRETVALENGSAVVTHELEFFLPKLSDTVRDAIQAIIDESPCGLCAIAEDSNGTKWVLGYNETATTNRPLRIATENTTSGKAFSDLNGSTVTMSSTDGEKARVYTGTVTV